MPATSLRSAGLCSFCLACLACLSHTLVARQSSVSPCLACLSHSQKACIAPVSRVALVRILSFSLPCFHARAPSLSMPSSDSLSLCFALSAFPPFFHSPPRFSRSLSHVRIFLRRAARLEEEILNEILRRGFNWISNLGVATLFVYFIGPKQF